MARTGVFVGRAHVIFAELHDKLGEDGCGSHDRMEDVLTSNVFGLLRYLPPDRSLLLWLAQAEPVGNGPVLGKANAVETIFWPRLGDGEADILLALETAPGEVDLVVVECKYESKKSGRAREGRGGCEAQRDQLAKYALALFEDRFDIRLLRGRRVRRRAIVYLTASAGMPRDEIEESLGALRDSTWSDRFYWLSWDRLWSVLTELDREESNYRLVAGDILALLRRKALRPFSGFGRLRPLALGSPSWRSRWGLMQDLRLETSVAMWRRQWGMELPSLPRSAVWHREAKETT